jgi:hypothetical protein
VHNACNSLEDDEDPVVGVNRGPRASWQLLVQREPNGTWRRANEYPRLVASDDVTKVNHLLLAEQIKERLGTTEALLPQFAGHDVSTYRKSRGFMSREMVRCR